MTKTMLYKHLLQAIRSQLFFRLTLIWFGLQASWLALTALYPMAYDEEFHFRVMHLYADRLHPFWSSTPPDSSTYGAVIRDPSYMYHFIMSFPLRLVEQIIPSETGQIIFLRFCSIGFFILGLWLFRKVLRRAGVSSALSNVVIFMLAATPLVPFLAAQVNYDNLVFALLPASILYFQTIIKTLRSKNKLDLSAFSKWCLLVMFASIVKYAFLPFLLAMSIVLVYYYVKFGPKNWSLLLKDVQKQFQKFGRWSRVVLIGGFAILFILCFERYGINTIRYGTPTPECNQVLTIEECLDFGPWRRNYYTRQSKLAGRQQPRDTSFHLFAVQTWLSQITYQLFYTLDGPRAGYQVGWAYRVPRISSVIIMLTGLGLYIWRFGYIRRHYSLHILLLLAGVYLLTLMLQNYADFLHLGYPFGIQGRYLIPTLPVVYAVVGVSFASVLHGRQWAKTALATIAMVVIVTQGGGVATYILRSKPEWYWPNQTVVQANNIAKRLLQPIVFDP